MLEVMAANELLEQAEMLSARCEYAGLERMLCDVPLDVLEATPELLHLRANANLRIGNYKQALELVHKVEWLASTSGNSRLYRRHRILLGVLLLELGQVTSAQQIFAEVAWLSHGVGDDFGLGIATMNQGVASDIRCDWEAALVSYQRAIAAFEQDGAHSWVPRCHHNMAMAYRQMGRLAEASSYSDQSLSGLVAHGSASDVLCAKAERALLFELGGDHSLAVRIASASLRQAETIADPRSTGELLRVNGTLLLVEGDLLGAKRLLRRGLRLSKHLGAKMLEAELLEELAVCDAREGAHTRAAVKMARAAKVFGKMGAHLRAQRGWARLGGG